MRLAPLALDVPGLAEGRGGDDPSPPAERRELAPQLAPTVCGQS